MSKETPPAPEPGQVWRHSNSELRVCDVVDGEVCFVSDLCPGIQLWWSMDGWRRWSATATLVEGGEDGGVN